MKPILLAIALLLGSCSLQPAFASLCPSPELYIKAGYSVESPRKAVQGVRKGTRYPGSHKIRQASWANVGALKAYPKKKAPKTWTEGRVGSAGCGPRPGAWCGWYMCTQLGPVVKNPNLASNWLKYGSPTHPQIGAVVVYNHHVGRIVGYDKRGWLVRSGNYSNRVAVHPMNYRKPIGIRI